jgi:hypothetical protein
MRFKIDLTVNISRGLAAVRSKGCVWACDGEITHEAGGYGEGAGDANVITVFFCGLFRNWNLKRDNSLERSSSLHLVEPQ